jgi:hypothetical protein
LPGVSTVREEAHKLVDQLPDESSSDDLMYQIYTHKKVELGRLAIAEGCVLNQEEAEKRMASWLERCGGAIRPLMTSLLPRTTSPEIRPTTQPPWSVIPATLRVPLTTLPNAPAGNAASRAAMRNTLIPQQRPPIRSCGTRFGYANDLPRPRPGVVFYVVTAP